MKFEKGRRLKVRCSAESQRRAHVAALSWLAKGAESLRRLEEGRPLRKDDEVKMRKRR